VEQGAVLRGLVGMIAASVPVAQEADAAREGRARAAHVTQSARARQLPDGFDIALARRAIVGILAEDVALRRQREGVGVDAAMAPRDRQPAVGRDPPDALEVAESNRVVRRDGDAARRMRRRSAGRERDQQRKRGLKRRGSPR
jgi:hypothetical protein